METYGLLPRQILLFPFHLPTNQLMICDGSLLPTAQNQALFALLGTTFGGDGKVTFAIPSYRKIAPEGSNYYIVVQGQFPQSHNFGGEVF